MKHVSSERFYLIDFPLEGQLPTMVFFRLSRVDYRQLSFLQPFQCYSTFNFTPCFFQDRRGHVKIHVSLERFNFADFTLEEATMPNRHFQAIYG